MVAEGCRIEVPAFSTVMNAYVSQRPPQLAAAESLMAEAQALGLVADTQMYNLLLKGYASAVPPQPVAAEARLSRDSFFFRRLIPLPLPPSSPPLCRRLCRSSRPRGSRCRSLRSQRQPALDSGEAAVAAPRAALPPCLGGAHVPVHGRAALRRIVPALAGCPPPARAGDGRVVRGGEGRGGAAPRAAVRAVAQALRRHLQRTPPRGRAAPRARCRRPWTRRGYPRRC